MQTFSLSCCNMDSPPPYAFEFKVQMDQHSNEVTVEYTYLHREHLDAQDWIEAGIPEEKDWKWKGTVHPALIQQLLGWKDINLEQFPNRNSACFEVTIQDDRMQRTGYILEQSDHAWKIQELLQGIKESADMESPLQVFIKKGQTIGMLEAVFAQQALYWHAQTDTRIDLDWTILRSLISLMSRAEDHSKEKEVSISWDGDHFFPLMREDAEALTVMLGL